MDKTRFNNLGSPLLTVKVANKEYKYGKLYMHKQSSTDIITLHYFENFYEKRPHSL